MLSILLKEASFERFWRDWKATQQDGQGYTLNFTCSPDNMALSKHLAKRLRKPNEFAAQEYWSVKVRNIEILLRTFDDNRFDEQWYKFFVGANIITVGRDAERREFSVYTLFQHTWWYKCRTNFVSSTRRPSAASIPSAKKLLCGKFSRCRAQHNFARQTTNRKIVDLAQRRWTANCWYRALKRIS